MKHNQHQSSYKNGVKDLNRAINSLTKFQNDMQANMQAITADMVTYKMMVDCNNNADSVLSPADFVAAVNSFIKHKGDTK